MEIQQILIKGRQYTYLLLNLLNIKNVFTAQVGDGKPCSIEEGYQFSAHVLDCSCRECTSAVDQILVLYPIREVVV